MRYENSSTTRRTLVEGERRTVQIKCCGAWLDCEAFTNTCEHCEADYNFAGQRLAPRSQWGEETGEHWSDCY